MSDFPKCGDIKVTRAWLDKEGFERLFLGWKADALLGADKDYILKKAGEDKGERLWGLLNTARTMPTGNFLSHSSQFFNISF